MKSFAITLTEDEYKCLLEMIHDKQKAQRILHQACPEFAATEPKVEALAQKFKEAQNQKNILGFTGRSYELATWSVHFPTLMDLNPNEIHEWLKSAFKHRFDVGGWELMGDEYFKIKWEGRERFLEFQVRRSFQLSD